MKKFIITLMAVALVATGGAAVVYAVDSGSTVAAHNATGPQGTCSKCHIPHGGKGDKIWAQELTVATDFGGVQLLCNSCHRTGDTWGADSGEDNVFNLNAYMNHVMWDWADVAGGEATFSTAVFPVDTSDTSTVPSTGTADHTNEGFYCGSCHNPHKQPFASSQSTGNGDYLRTTGAAPAANMTAFGTSGVREGACLQCHGAKFAGTVASGHEGNCMTCHHPHEGIDLPTGTTEGDNMAEKILIASGTASPFSANPNVQAFGTAAGNIAGICFDCHSQTGGSYLPDTDKLLTTVDEHHPMGTNATTGGSSHAPGWTGGELTCTGCHAVHNATQDYYLDSAAGTYASQDDGGYCADVCHTQNDETALGDSGSDHNQTTAGAGNSRGSCFMCHYIHDGDSNSTATDPGDEASEDALMRQNATNLAWADTVADADDNDYEDLCYACHGDTTMVGTNATPATGSLLDTLYFSHRFVATPDTTGANPTATNLTNYGLPVATATTGYGAISGQMYCGTCHDVHTQAAAGLDSDGNYFINSHNAGTLTSGLCKGCHGSEPSVGGGTTHPIDTPPNTPYTATGWVSMYTDGADNSPGNGRTVGASATGDISCETCHAFHGGNTNHLGGTEDGTAGSQGKVLVKENGPQAGGTSSEMCADCHDNY